mmetsp:Transcript_8457/g.7991  ORF Transcript_8457/g.7991 Transcript_8457/m.7991 type:complete len:87 (+) Transcript_8457:145-405(+)
MCNKDNGGTHITVFASLSNLSSVGPRLYSYKVVDKFGLFIPTLLGSFGTLVVLILIKPLVNTLSQAKREDFDVDKGYQSLKADKND